MPPVVSETIYRVEQNSPKTDHLDSSSKRKRTREIWCWEEKNFPTTRSKTKAIKLMEEIKKVWHGNGCPSCADLYSIKKEIMACLQHHYKHCSCYSIYYRLMAILQTKVKSLAGRIKKEFHFLNSDQAKQICIAASNKQKCVKNARLFKKAADLSDQLIGPAETAKFDCNRYEEYLTLLLDIADNILKTDDKELIQDIKNYLKPFSQTRTDDESSTDEALCVEADTRLDASGVKKTWNETYLELRHPFGDEEFGKNLKEIVQPKRGERCIFFPQKYDFPCHGQ
ncbi:hypothetical protein DAPPUDRAFT_224229 [Daphnia pulex]|uniref:Uncharacterized protein n=1 Tax=Daphnia pulex TaxID=6669 RepID=E9GGB4_DAPPU|nr:hypothetical protein DAPPUDRAFT_224229 [Daphnia pulex]|eukprot:EFX81371.1 hypothetical protein DAPPUDRAFT_224229 [Daphnia pulex]